MKKTNFSIRSFRGMLTTSFFFLSLQAHAAVQTVYISPNQVESGKAFQVTLTGKAALCHPQFSHHEVAVSAGQIHFTVMGMSDPAADCIADELDYKTDFQVPALKSGTYAVTVSLEPPCRNSIPACLSPSYLENGGILTVRDSGSQGYGVRPEHVQAGKPFDLDLTSMHWNCYHEFSNRVSEVDGHSIYLSATTRVRPGIICIQILQELAISYMMKALPAGTYQVFAMEHPYCEPGTACPMVKMAWQHAGAFTVGEGLTALDKPKGSEEIRGANGEKVLRIEAGHGVRTWWKGLRTNLVGGRLVH